VALPKDCRASMSVLDGYKRSEPQAVEILNLSGQGMRIKASKPVAAGTLVRIDLNQTLLLGEVCYSEADGNGFALGLRLEHSLLRTASLEQLRQRVAAEETEWVHEPSRR
jgi:PilZ domain